MQNLKFNDISPFVRYYHKFFAKDERMICRGEEYISYDNKLLYCCEGEINIFVKGQKYRLKKGAVLYFKAGIEYQYENFNNAELIAINFDLTQKSANINQPIIPPVSQNFNIDGLTEMVILTDCPPLNNIIFSENFSDSLPDILRIGNIYNSGMRYCHEKSNSLLKFLLAELLANSEIGEKYETVKSKASDIISYIEKHYKEKINNISIGKALNYHPYYLNRIMVKYTGTTLHQYLLNYRIKMATELLKNGKYSVGQVGEMVGFETINHFTNTFKKITGTLPSQHIPI